MKGLVALILFSVVTVVRGQEMQATPTETQTALVMHGRELTASNIAQGRDLKLYDDGGHFDCRQVPPPPIRRLAIAIFPRYANSFGSIGRRSVEATFALPSTASIR